MFYLKDKKKSITAIEAVVSFSGKKYKYATGQSVDPEQWKGERAKYTKAHPEGKKINAELDKIEKAVKNSVAFYTERNKQPGAAEFRDKVHEFLTGTTSTQKIPFTDCIEKYYKAKNFKYATYKKFITCIGKLNDYQTEKNTVLFYDDITINFYYDFKTWFFSLEKEPGVFYSANYFGSMVKIIKKVMNHGLESGLHSNRRFLHSDFSVDSESSDSVYLSSDELRRIYELDINDANVAEISDDKRPQQVRQKVKALQRVRDRFLIGAFTGLRVSDFNRLADVHFYDGFLRISTIKTQQAVVIPVHPIVNEIIENGGLSYRVSEQKINKHIKEVCLLAGITAQVAKTVTRGGSRVETVLYKYQLVSSHTARRSAATNMYKAGIPSISIMKITGHKTEKSFMKYIRISQEENAEILKNHPYFAL